MLTSIFRSRFLPLSGTSTQVSTNKPSIYNKSSRIPVRQFQINASNSPRCLLCMRCNAVSDSFQTRMQSSKPRSLCFIDTPAMDQNVVNPVSFTRIDPADWSYLLPHRLRSFSAYSINKSSFSFLYTLGVRWIMLHSCTSSALSCWSSNAIIMSSSKFHGFTPGRGWTRSAKVASLYHSHHFQPQVR